MECFNTLAIHVDIKSAPLSITSKWSKEHSPGIIQTFFSNHTHIRNSFSFQSVSPSCCQVYWKLSSNASYGDGVLSGEVTKVITVLLRCFVNRRWRTIPRMAVELAIKSFYRTQVRSSPCLVIPTQNDLVETWLLGFVKIVTWISLSCNLDLSKLLHGFL